MRLTDAGRLVGGLSNYWCCQSADIEYIGRLHVMLRVLWLTVFTDDRRQHRQRVVERRHHRLALRH